MSDNRVIDLSKFYSAAQAAEVLTENSGHTVRPDYLRVLVAIGLLEPIKVAGRSLYSKEAVDSYVVREKRRKSGNIVA